MKEIPCDFGSELRRRRGERGFNLVTFSKMISYSKGHLSKVETGQAIASLNFAKVCDEVLAANGELVALVSGGEPRGTRSSKTRALVGLPVFPSHFVGRSEELACIANYLTGGGGTVCAISGMGGVGKTFLALRGAWGAADLFPDGCFFFDFEESHDMRDVLDSLLRLIGVPSERIPSRPDAMANLWRSQLSGKRLLLVLDNVCVASDIASLLSAEPGYRLLVTSRRRLSALDGAVHLPVGVLSDVEADALFRVVGGERAAHAADHVVRAVVEHCGRLPLAVRIAAARFRSGPTRTVSEFEEMLSDEACRLEVLDDGDRSVNAVLSVSCDGLTTEQRQLLVLLTLHPGQRVDLRSVAALADINLPRAALLMDNLADVHLVAYESSDHVTVHDLVLQFARRLLPLHMTVEEQHSAVRRLLEYSLRVAVVADQLLTPQRYRPPFVLDDFPPRPAPFSDRAAAVAWFEAEWRCLAALCRTAAARGFYSLCWQLAFVLRDFFFLAKLWGPWIETHLAAVESARTAGARAWLAISLGNLGVAHSDRGDLIMACQYFRQSLTLYKDLGDEHGVVNTISNLAWTELYLGEYRKSLDGLRAALNHYRRLGNRRNAAIALRGIALLEAELELCPAAVKHAQEAREEFVALGLELDAVMSVNCAAWANFRSGDHQAAGAAYEEAVVMAESCGSRYEKARSLTGLGNIRQALGRREEAVELWDQADTLYGGLEPVMLGEARVRLAS